MLSTISYKLPDNVERLTLLGTANIAGSGNDLANIITGNSGNNLLTGFGGADTFVELRGFGQDTLTDFKPNNAPDHDTVQLSTAEFANYAAVLAAAHQSGADVVIQAGSDMLTLHNVLMTSLTSNDFVFV